VGLYGRNSGEFKGGGEGGPLLAQFLKPPFSVKKAYRSLCAFAINEDGTCKLSPPFKIFGSATGQKVNIQCNDMVAVVYRAAWTWAAPGFLS